MVNDMKLALKSLRYAYNWKVTAVSAVLLTLLSMAILIFGNIEMRLYLYGIYFLSVFGMFPVQLLYSMSASNMVLTSSVRKRMQTSVPAVLCCSSMMLGYLVAAVILGVKILRHPELYIEACVWIVSAVVFVVLIMLYMALAYKYFVFSTVVFAFACPVLLIGVPDMLTIFFQQVPGLKLVYLPCVLLGLVIIAAGGFLEYLLSLLVYRAPMSKQAQAASLRKEM